MDQYWSFCFICDSFKKEENCGIPPFWNEIRFITLSRLRLRSGKFDTVITAISSTPPVPQCYYY